MFKKIIRKIFGIKKEDPVKPDLAVEEDKERSISMPTYRKLTFQEKYFSTEMFEGYHMPWKGEDDYYCVECNKTKERCGCFKSTLLEVV